MSEAASLSPETPLPDIGKGASLSGASLPGRNFSGQDLEGVDFSSANLEGASFFRAHLHGANFSGADIRNAEFAGADLSGANLENVNANRSGFGRACLKDASLFRANLQDATLTQADLENANLSCADLRGARIREGRLLGANLAEADMRDTDLSLAEVSRANFYNTDLRGARLRRIRGFKKATWIGVDIRDINFAGAYLMRREVIDQNFIKEFRSYNNVTRLLYYPWWLTCDCGRSMLRWCFWIGVQTLFFAWIYSMVGIDFGDHPTWLSPLYFSVVTLTTLGYGDVTPASLLAQCVAMSEVIIGYMMLGGLLSIFSNKLARRGD